jgi:photosystem II stability/assembly factor-like uncharacterized protein/dienelactone hydrolase
MKKIILGVLSVLMGAGLAAGQSAGDEGPLARRPGPIGVRLVQGGGLEVTGVVGGSAAEAAGMKEGDRIIKVSGVAVASREEMSAQMRKVKPGDAAEVVVQRGAAEEVTLKVTARAATEFIEGSVVRYDSVRVPAGYRLRTIISEPAASPLAVGGKAPAFFFVQGMMCDSIDRPERPDVVDTRLVHAMAKAGFVTMRVDKPGLGDSQGPPCSEIDFDTELKGYQAALEQLASLPGVDPNRIYLFGHSMGGVMMPYLASGGKVRGSIVYGTLARTWFEYQLENVRRQSAFQPGVTEAQITEAVQAEAKSSSMILLEKKTLGDVWARWPELRQPTQGLMLDETHMATRHMSFYHQLQDLNIAGGWQDSKGSVLAIWGEFDWVASKADHQKIVDIVNARTAGAGTLLVMPAADHAFTTHESFEQSIGAMGAGQWDATLPEQVLSWIAGVEGRASKAAASTAAQTAPAAEAPVATATGASALPAWKQLKTEPYQGKQDDIFFVNPRVGWYGNGAGKVFHTTDGGETWVKQWEQKGTFVRCLAFFDEKVGVIGNIGPGYFPGVTDNVPLYRTEDGGATWTPVTAIDGPPVVGLCAIEIVQVPFINAGKLDHKPRIIGVGRVGGPVAYIWSDDMGKTWKQGTIPEPAAMAFDVKFIDEQHGFIASATSADLASAHALILATQDGGATWQEVYRSNRPFETTWKFSFPTKKTGYCTIQSYNPDTEASKRFVAKTVDGGRTWSEIPLVDDHKVREFGIAFLDEQTGWIGAMPGGFGTTDGGKTWSKVSFGNAVNKIRLVRTPEEVVAYAIGVNVYKAQVSGAGAASKTP